jgi:putative inorganic carbon (hco3(-)) transporter
MMPPRSPGWLLMPTPNHLSAESLRDRSEPQTATFELMFVGYLLLVGLEYSGLSRDFPIIRQLHVGAALSNLLLIAAVWSGRMKGLLSSRQMKLLVGFVVLTALSVLYAYVRARAYAAIRPLFDAIVMTALTAILIDRRSRLNAFVAMLSICVVFLVARNLDRLGQSERAGGWDAPYFMGDQNDFAWALNVILPLTLILMRSPNGLMLRLIGMAGAGAAVLGIIGTTSRGGTLGLAASMLCAMLFVAKRRTLALSAVAVVAVGVLLLAPKEYFARMETVGTYEEDNSARARLQAWSVAIQMAKEHPLGVGAENFNSAYGRRYLPRLENQLDWAAERWISPHSVYFKILGEFGFPGLIMLLWLLGSTVRDNFRAQRTMNHDPSRVVIDDRWPSIINMSVIGFSVSGMFLGGFSYPHMFILVGFTLGVQRILAAQPVTPSPAPSPAPRPTRRLSPRVVPRPSGFAAAAAGNRSVHFVPSPRGRANARPRH